MSQPDSSSNGSDEIMVFGVNLKERKCVSLENLSQYQAPAMCESSNNNNLNVSVAATATAAANTGYVSADNSIRNLSTGRKRGIPWTEDEHRLFLKGLLKTGRGQWKEISRNFVPTRSPSQIASHAQKYFLHQCNFCIHRRRRSSLFNITTDSVAAMQTEEQVHGDQVMNSGSTPDSDTVKAGFDNEDGMISVN